MELVSVVIPVYNVEQYINKCIKSVLAQSYTNLDIILVDDGSTDRSGKMCDKYARKDARIRVIHKKNGGLSDARNKGIEEAMGSYITFIDSDDYVSPNYINNLYGLVKQNRCDIGITCAIKFNHKTQYLCKAKSIRLEETKIFNSEQAIRNMLYRQDIPIYAWAKIYSKSLFDHIKFPVGELFEDLGTEYLLFHEAAKIAFNPIKDYFYLQRMNSIINSNYNSKKMIQVYDCEKIIEFVKEKYPKIEKAAISKCFITTLNHYLNIPKSKEFISDRKYSLNVIKKYRKNVLYDTQNKKIVRLLAGISMVNVEIIYLGAILYRFLLSKNILKMKKPI